jgi:hypothetical protein
MLFFRIFSENPPKYRELQVADFLDTYDAGPANLKKNAKNRKKCLILGPTGGIMAIRGTIGPAKLRAEEAS